MFHTFCVLAPYKEEVPEASYLALPPTHFFAGQRAHGGILLTAESYTGMEEITRAWLCNPAMPLMAETRVKMPSGLTSRPEWHFVF
jgi:hypothetical protein